MLFLVSPTLHAEDLKLVRPMLSISNARFGNYWPNPKAKEPQYNAWSWLPRATFYLQGDMPPGGEVSIQYLLPNGQPWLKFPVPGSKVGETNYYVFGHDWPTQESGKPAKTIVGTFPFRIYLKNPLEGTNKLLYSGKYTVSKFHKGNALPQFKNQFEYVVDQDWRLPMAYITEDYSGSYSDSPVLQLRLYFKGHVAQERLEGVLYYKGKMIASKELRGGYTGNPFMLTTAGMDTKDPIWELWNFGWGGVRMRVPEFNKQTDHWYLSENPGAYELKVLRNGQLARSVKFNVGANGVVEDGGLGNSTNSKGLAIVPAKVLGTTDGKWNALAWKNGAFYGNPLQGFTAP